MAVSRTLTSKVPVTTYEEKVTGVELTLTAAEAQELRNVLGAASFDFEHISQVRRALEKAGFLYQSFSVQGNVGKTTLNRTVMGINI